MDDAMLFGNGLTDERTDEQGDSRSRIAVLHFCINVVVKCPTGFMLSAPIAPPMYQYKLY